CEPRLRPPDRPAHRGEARGLMRPPLWHLRCPRCETIFALPVWPDSCPRCQLGELTRIDPTGDAAVTYFAGTMR
ncbi:MAG: hypothetical protein RI531_09765, partial [Haloferacaceae archaeon]|nr:hypothetical protein [Haloferacaceae archaeon]